MPPFMCSMLSNKKRLCGASDPAEGRPYQNESPFILLRKYKIVKSNQAKPNQVKSDGEGLKDTKRIGLSSVRGRARTSKTG